MYLQEVAICLVFYTTTLATSSKNGLQIIGGRNTSITKHPYQVAVSLFGEFSCSGVVLNEQWVLTTGSCVAGCEYEPDIVSVRAKSDSYRTGGVYFNCSLVVINENFTFFTQDYDIAVLKIEGKFKFGKKLKPIKFGSKRLKTGKSGVISGWGSTGNDTASSEILKELDVTVVSQPYCGKKYKDYTLTDRMFCADSEDFGPCWNDDADPLVVNNRLYGLLSFNKGCFNTSYPSVYSNIPSLKGWIYKTIKNNTI